MCKTWHGLNRRRQETLLLSMLFVVLSPLVATYKGILLADAFNYTCVLRLISWTVFSDDDRKGHDFHVASEHALFSIETVEVSPVGTTKATTPTEESAHNQLSKLASITMDVAGPDGGPMPNGTDGALSNTCFDSSSLYLHAHTHNRTITQSHNHTCIYIYMYILCNDNNPVK